MIELSKENKTSKMGREKMDIVETIYDSGHVWKNGKRILLMHYVSTVAGRTLESWFTQLEGDCTWIGCFKSQEKALSFYVDCRPLK